ncbi:tryptophan N-monooxygenase CYP79A68-like [Coffea arabica]|uniref:Tryptophan N-monooxygenase CYP79A68-like n=1 Tax=Coffea arabica TaxID=13443 RepID=A0A6P6VMD0_COFAR|nr:tyrosine N-monooxygenase-like [Coffea arabica]
MAMPVEPPLILAFILLFIIIKWGHNSFKKSRLGPKLPPGPSPWPIVGNIPELYKNKPPFYWIDGIMKKLNTDVACFRLGSVHVIVVNSPQVAREFLHNHDDKLASRPFTMATELSSRGFLSMAVSPWGPQWKKMRKMYTSELMTPARHRWLIEKRNQEADNYVSFILNQCKSSGRDGAVVDVRTALRHYAINVVRKVVFNTRYFGEGGKDGGPGDEEKEHVKAIFTILRHLYAFCVSDYLPWLRVLDIDNHEKIVKEALGVMNKYHDPIIEERITKRRINGEKQGPQDLLDVMISLKDATGQPLLSEEEIKAQCIELFFGVDSPTTSLEWAVAQMINKPEIQQKAVDEIDRVVGKGRLVQESDIPQLNYVKACVKESLRLHPITPFNLPHVSMSNIVVGGYFIPKGSHILLGRRGLGRNPKVWQEPLEFKPERYFNDDQSSKIELMEPELRLVTFSSGKRACPGIALGTALSVIALGRILQGFAWSVPENEGKIDLTEAPNEFEMAKPLHAHASPRLPATTYPITS